MTYPDGGPPLSREHRETFAVLADVLVPRLGKMPAASEVDTAGRGLERVLRSRPDLAASLTTILDNAKETHPEEVIRRLDSDEKEDFATLFVAVAGAYYMSSEVKDLLGYPGQQAIPADAEEQLEALTRPQIQRGRIYREAD